MFEALDNMKRYGPMTALVICFFFIFVSGIYFGVIYYMMDTSYDALEAHDCVIENNSLVTSCQELWEMTIYKFLDLREIIVWFSFFFIFALVLSMLMMGYQSGSSGGMLGAMTLFILALTYGGILFSNVYRTMLEVPAFRSMMVEFTVYNELMLSFPWFVFFVGVFSVMLGFVNFQKAHVNEAPEALDY